MKYLLIAFVAALVATGCASNSGGPGEGSYKEGANDRHSMNHVSDSLRSGPAFAH